jgi:hypothetical protein
MRNVTETPIQEGKLLRDQLFVLGMTTVKMRNRKITTALYGILSCHTLEPGGRDGT